MAREPKLASCMQVLGEHDGAVKGMLEEFGVRLRPGAYKQVCARACNGSPAYVIMTWLQHHASDLSQRPGSPPLCLGSGRHPLCMHRTPAVMVPDQRPGWVEGASCVLLSLHAPHAVRVTSYGFQTLYIPFSAAGH